MNRQTRRRTGVPRLSLRVAGLTIQVVGALVMATQVAGATFSWEQWPSRTRAAAFDPNALPGDRQLFLPRAEPFWLPGIQERWRLDRQADFGFGVGGSVNRVDGASVLSRQAILNDHPWRPSLDFYQGYGFGSERWSGAAEVRLHPGHQAWVVGGRWADETCAWFLPRTAITPEESVLGASVLREDFSDYLRRRGYQGFLRWAPGYDRGLQLTWAEENQESVERSVARYGPFGGNKRFRGNPEIESGDWSTLSVRAAWSEAPRRLQESTPLRSLFVETQWGGGVLGDGRAFTRVWAEHRGSAYLSPSQSIGYRVGGGFAPVGIVDSTGSRLPTQWQFQAGGVGSLRGHKFREFVGDRTVLGTVEYQIDPADGFQTSLFIDTGLAWNESAAEGGGIGGSGPLALDGGIGLTLGTQGLRIDVARDLRKERAPARITARLSLPY
ncbi:MAG: BamA/TamA family outer membrane protein [Candidatus Eisenbacteria bacterium]|nr:BamA/TamA family outer membrane protein [Candidatus Eisenbacteria bacterium]MCC7143617.1 BamA/TamA family outer membrane protein [Candidatus Eisenbacteria bacterium]